MWINEVNYVTGADAEFIEIGVPVDGGFRAAFTVEVYALSGALIDTRSVAAATAAAAGIACVSVGGIALPDAGIAVALVDANGSVRDFKSFGNGSSPVTAGAGGAAEGLASEAVMPADTSGRSLGMYGFAGGPSGWTFQRSDVGKQTSGAINNTEVLIVGRATAGNDKLIGNAGHNTIDGGDGRDYLFGLAGNDTLRGGNGDDGLSGGSGADSLGGGAGSDTASYIDAHAGVGLNFLGGPGGGDALGDTFSSIEAFRLSDFADSVAGGVAGAHFNLEGGADTFAGAGAVNDTVQGRGGADSLFGGGGDDRLVAGAGADLVRGDGGDDRIVLGADGSVDTVAYQAGNAGTDFVFGYEAGLDVIELGSAVATHADTAAGAVLTLANGTEITVANIAFADIVFV